LPSLLLLFAILILASMPIPALLVLIYLIIAIVLIRRVNTIFIDGLNLKRHNVGLVDSLTEHNQELEHLLVKLNDSEKLSVVPLIRLASL